MVTGTAQEYNQANIQDLMGQYANAMQPQYNRSAASIANILGGRGTLQGTPGLNQLQLLQAQRESDIGKYGMGLMQTGLEAGRQERLTGEQRAYETPTNIAQLTGTLPGSTGTYSPTAGWTWTGSPTTTIGGTTAQAAMTQANNANLSNQVAQLKWAINFLSGIPGLSDIIKSVPGLGTLLGS